MQSNKHPQTTDGDIETEVNEVRKAQVQAQVSLDRQMNSRDVPLEPSELRDLALKKAENEKNSALVRSTVEEKFNQLQKETRKLQLIKNELAKLDHALAKNIDLLRREIETVGKDVTTSQMDFNVKEKEYLRARELLAKNKKRKALLTAHLDHIILHNENAKASKLQELERQLGMPDSSTTSSIPSTGQTTTTKQPQPSQFSGFSPEEVAGFSLDGKSNLLSIAQKNAPKY